MNAFFTPEKRSHKQFEKHALESEIERYHTKLVV